MDWTEELSQRLKRKNQIYFSQESPLFQDLRLLLEEVPRRTAVLWALDLAAGTVQDLALRYPGEERPREALELTRLWAAGTVKMPEAKRAILACHTLAKELPSPEDAALCHAVGQACSVVHTKGHALGYPIYELTALVRRHGPEACRGPVERRSREYVRRLLFWKEPSLDPSLPWADFLLKD